MIGGGDQLYCDAITKEKELQGELAMVVPFNSRPGYINAKSRKDKIKYDLTEEMKIAIDRF